MSPAVRFRLHIAREHVGVVLLTAHAFGRQFPAGPPGRVGEGTGVGLDLGELGGRAFTVFVFLLRFPSRDLGITLLSQIFPPGKRFDDLLLCGGIIVELAERRHQLVVGQLPRVVRGEFFGAAGWGTGGRGSGRREPLQLGDVAVDQGGVVVELLPVVRVVRGAAGPVVAAEPLPDVRELAPLWICVTWAPPSVRR